MITNNDDDDNDDDDDGGGGGYDDDTTSLLNATIERLMLKLMFRRKKLDSNKAFSILYRPLPLRPI